MKRAVFLDRDGTLIVEKNYLSNPAQVVLFSDAGTALRKLADAGFMLFIVTNQSGIGRGYYSLEDMHAVNRRVAEVFSASGVSFQEIYFAPEAPEAPSRGRKPSPAFLFDARGSFDIDLNRSYMIGDKRIDLECGQNAGVRKSILVRTGYGAEVAAGPQSLPPDSMVLDSLSQASDWILKDSMNGA